MTAEDVGRLVGREWFPPQTGFDARSDEHGCRTRLVPCRTSCFLGAGSLVLGDVPDNVLMYGAPARVIRSRKPGGQFLKSG